MTTAQRLTHSRLSCFRSCPRKHYLRYELGLQRDSDGLPRRVGSAFHAALEAADLGCDVDAALHTGIEDPYELAMVAAMYDGHRRRWGHDRLEAVASELEFDLPLVNPDTGAATSVWRLAGKIDRIVRLQDGRLALQEYKTTSLDFSPGSDYWLKLHLDQQLSLYVIAARRYGFDIDTILYDVTRRPGLRPYKATPEENRKYHKQTGELYKGQRAEDETPEEYAARIATDIAERPDHYFARIEIPRLEQDLEDCASELWQQQQVLREFQKSGRWYRSPSSCFGMFRCDYVDVCQNRDLETVTPDGFVRLSDPHPELSNAESD